MNAITVDDLQYANRAGKNLPSYILLAALIMDDFICRIFYDGNWQDYTTDLSECYQRNFLVDDFTTRVLRNTPDLAFGILNNPCSTTLQDIALHILRHNFWYLTVNSALLGNWRLRFRSEAEQNPAIAMLTIRPVFLCAFTDESLMPGPNNMQANISTLVPCGAIKLFYTK